MRGIHLFMIIVALPALAAFGHDIYLFYENYGFDHIQRDLSLLVEEKGPLSPLASLGFIWTQYHEASYTWVVENADPETWAVINEILGYKALFAGLAFAGVFYVILVLLKLFGLWPFRREKKVSRFARGRRAGTSSEPMKYKRK